MIKLSAKIVSAIVGVAAVGTISVTAATANHPAAVANTSLQTSSVTSSMVSSSATESKGEVKTVDDGISAIQKATDDGVSRIKDETVKAVSEIEDKADAQKPTVNKKSCFPVIDPDTLETVYTTDSNYTAVCQRLGGDAGTTSMEKSTACAPYYQKKVQQLKQGAIAACQGNQKPTAPTK